MIMTTVGGNSDQLSEFPDCVACDEHTPEALSQAILTAIAFHKSSDNWGERNRMKYETDFTARSFAKRWDDAVDTL